MPKRVIRASHRWPIVLTASLLSAVAQLIYVAASGAAQAAAFGIIPGGIAAYGLLRVWRTRTVYLLSSFAAGIGVSVAVWAVMAGAGHGRWVSPLDALLCPVAGFAVGMLDRRHGGPGSLLKPRV